MKMARLGNNEISRIVLGTWVMGGSHWGAFDENSAKDAIAASLDSGITAIDTAPAYGNGKAEEIVGQVLSGSKRDSVFIATKCGLDPEKHFAVDLSPGFIEKDLERSLSRLQTEYVDLYQCHWPDPGTPVEETMEALVRFQESGKIRYIGVSNFSDELLRRALKCAPVVSIQSHYSLLERSIEKDIMKTCISTNTAILTYGSIGAGMLTGKYREWHQFPKNDARSFFYKFYKKKYWPGVRALVDELETVADEINARPAQVAVAWILSVKGITSALVGARNRKQALENSAAAEIELESSMIERLSRLSDQVYNQG